MIGACGLVLGAIDNSTTQDEAGVARRIVAMRYRATPLAASEIAVNACELSSAGRSAQRLRDLI